MHEHTNMAARRYEPAMLAKGERALLQLALKHFIHNQQAMISEAHAKYKAKEPKVFEDHKLHHQQQIDAAGDLLERFQRGGWRSIPTKGDEK